MIITERESSERVAARNFVYIIAPKTCSVMREILQSGDSENLHVAKSPLNETNVSCLETDNRFCGECTLISQIFPLSQIKVEVLSNAELNKFITSVSSKPLL